MAALVTKLNRAKKYRCSTHSFHNTLKFLKKYAHKSDRRACRRALKKGEDYYSTPKLTGWDII